MAASTLEVIITGNSSGLVGALNQGAAASKAFGTEAQNASKTAKSALGSIGIGAAAAGLAVAAFAKQSFEAATAFDQSMTQIAALTDTTSKQLGVMRENVVRLAGETAQSPVALANAMYFLASAGLDAQQQMETLEASAKGAAVGLGEAGDIARITANALNVYGDSGLKAADVTDTLVAAVREGSAEPDEFAGALGRVLPIADKAGISFQQVAASLATMSNAGLDVNEGVTALRGALQSLVAPTQQTQDALGDIGLTVDDVVNSLQGQGLIATLRMLDEEARKNTDSTGQYNILMRQLVPNVRALTGVFNLTGQQAKKVDEIFKDVVHSTGDLDTAFQTTAESNAFKFHKALNDLSIEGQTLAANVLPSVASGLGLVADHAKGLLQILTGFAALRFGLRLTSQIETTEGALGALGRGAQYVKGNLFSLGLVAASVGATFTVVKGVWDDAHINLEQIATQTKIAANELKFFRDQMDLSGSAFEGHSFEGFVTSLNGVGANLDELLGKVTPAIQRLQELGLTTGEWNTVIAQLQPLIDGTSGSIDRFVGEVTGAGDTIAQIEKDFAHGRLSFEEFQQNLTAIGVSVPGTMVLANNAVDGFGKHVTQTGNIVRNFMGMTGDEFAKWSEDVKGSFEDVSSVADITEGNLAQSLHQMAAAARLMNRDMEKLRDADWIPQGFLQFLTEQGPSAIHDFVGANSEGRHQMVADWKAYSKNFNDTMDGLTQAIKNLTRAITGVPSAHNTKFTSNAAEAKGQIADLGASLKQLDTSVVFDIKLHTHPGSPWPDEAMNAHLYNPMKRNGWKKVGDSWTFPLDVSVHSGMQRQVGDLWKRQAEDAAASVVALTSRAGSTPREGVGVVRHVAQSGSDAAFIKSVVSKVSKELNAAQARHYSDALRLLDKRTMESGARSDAAIKAALDKMGRLLDTVKGHGGGSPSSDARPWWDFALRNVPNMPVGESRHQRHHDQPKMRVTLDRKHFDQQMSYESSYRGY